MKAATIYSNSEQLADPEFAILPRFWVEQHEVEDACAGYSDSEWFLAFRGMTNVMTNSRNAIFTVLPKVAVGNSSPVCLLKEKALGFAFVAAANSFVFDYITRQKLAGANLNFFIVEQLPVFPPKTYSQPCPWPDTAKTLRDWLMPRVLELTYTAWDLEPFAKDSGFDGPPFRWEDARRFQLRCELDAAFFHLYGISRDNVEYIMDTFPIVRRKDEAQHGSYRTKETILALYDALADAQQTGQPFVSALNPPPADPRCCHPPREETKGSLLPYFLVMSSKKLLMAVLPLWSCYAARSSINFLMSSTRHAEQRGDSLTGAGYFLFLMPKYQPDRPIGITDNTVGRRMYPVSGSVAAAFMCLTLLEV